MCPAIPPHAYDIDAFLSWRGGRKNRSDHLRGSGVEAGTELVSKRPAASGQLSEADHPPTTNLKKFGRSLNGLEIRLATPMI